MSGSDKRPRHAKGGGLDPAGGGAGRGSVPRRMRASSAGRRAWGRPVRRRPKRAEATCEAAAGAGEQGPGGDRRGCAGGEAVAESCGEAVAESCGFSLRGARRMILLWEKRENRWGRGKGVWPGNRTLTVADLGLCGRGGARGWRSVEAAQIHITSTVGLC